MCPQNAHQPDRFFCDATSQPSRRNFPELRQAVAGQRPKQHDAGRPDMSGPADRRTSGTLHPPRFATPPHSLASGAEAQPKFWTFRTTAPTVLRYFSGRRDKGSDAQLYRHL